MNQEKNRCPHCGRITDKREISLFDGMVKSLCRVYKWCFEKNIHEFNRKEIEHLLLDGNQKARFGDWAMFGGLVYKTKKAHYGLNMERCSDFFNNKIQIPSKLWKDPITREITKVEYKFANEMPGLAEMLNQEGIYEPKYASQQQLTL